MMFGFPVETFLAIVAVLGIGALLDVLYIVKFDKSEDWWTF